MCVYVWLCIINNCYSEYVDECIRSSIRREFTEATVLTISRRVDTILDYDKIVVLKEGRVVEIGPPSELRDKPNGEFAGMLQTLWWSTV